MKEEVTPPSVEIVNQADCYFYYYSSCSKGKACPFRHEPAALRNETMCVYWLNGNCNKPQCIYRHMEITKQRDKIPCFFETQPGGCKKLHCPFLHNNVLDQPRDEDVPKNPDIILPVKDSEVEYEAEESETKKIQATVSAQLKFQRQMIESEESMDLPSPPVVVRQPVIVPLLEGESDSESNYCPSPHKSHRNTETNSDIEADWEIERLKEIQMEEGNILGYSFETDDAVNNSNSSSSRHAVVSSSSNDTYYDNEACESEEEVEEEEEEIVEDVEDAVHQRLRQPYHSNLIRPTNLRPGSSSIVQAQTAPTQSDQLGLLRRVFIGSTSKRIVRESSKRAQSSDDEEIYSVITVKGIPEKHNKSTGLSDRLCERKSVKERFGVNRNFEVAGDAKKEEFIKSRSSVGMKDSSISKESRVKQKDLDMESSRKSWDGSSKVSSRKSWDGSSKESSRKSWDGGAAKDARSLSHKSSKQKHHNSDLDRRDSGSDLHPSKLGAKHLRTECNESVVKIKKSSLALQNSKANLKPARTVTNESTVNLKESRLAMDNHVRSLKERRLGRKDPLLDLRETRVSVNKDTNVKDRLSSKSRIYNLKIPSSANIIIKSLAALKADKEKGRLGPGSISQERNLSSSTRHESKRFGITNYGADSIRSRMEDNMSSSSGSVNRMRAEEESGAEFHSFKVKTLAEIKAEKKKNSCSLHVPAKRSISPICFDDSPSKKSKAKGSLQSHPAVAEDITSAKKVLHLGTRKLAVKKLISKEDPNENLCRTEYVNNRNFDSPKLVKLKSVIKGQLGSVANNKQTVEDASFRTVRETSSVKASCNVSKPVIKLNRGNCDAKKLYRHTSESASNRNGNTLHRMDSLIDEDELLGTDIHEFEDDDDINEDELLL